MPVSRVLVEGNRQVSGEKVRRVLRVQRGDAFDRGQMADGLKRLFATKQFSDLKYYVETVGDSLVITVAVAEYRKVDGVTFVGNDHIDDNDLEAAITAGRGSFVRPALVAKDARAIAELYQEKGYFNAAVTDSIGAHKDSGAPVLVYAINEGEKVSVKHVDFEGVTAVNTDELRKIMETKEDAWFRGADYKPKEFEDDKARIAQYYRSKGYLDVVVNDARLDFSPDGKALDIVIDVDEGPRYRVGNVTWEGNEIVADSTIAKLIKLESGEVFDDLAFSQVQFDVNSIYWDKGHIYSNVSPIKTRRKGHIIDAEFRIDEGSPARVREIKIVGNTKTAENVIRRELVLNPGDVFLRPRLMRSVREIFNLGYFAAPPQITPTTASEDGDVDITLRVEEKPAGQFRLGAGFSQLNRVSGFIGVTEPNFLGRGLNVGFDWEFSKYRQNISASFTEPWLFGTPTSLSLSVFNRVQQQVAQQFYSDRRTGFSVVVGRPFPWLDYTRLAARYRFEGVELTDFASDYEGVLRDINWPQLTSSFGFTFIRNSTDSPFHPTRGTRTAITTTWTGGDLLGGDVSFQEYQLDFSYYEPLFWKFVLEVNTQVGILDGYDNPDQVPDYEKYRLGGNRQWALRGYDFFDVVPEGNAEFIGGRYMQILSYEVSYPIAPPTVYGVFFFDTGNTWNDLKSADPFDLKKGAGLGIRIELPALGTVGLDYGYGFDREDGAGWEPHITFGGGF